MSQVKWPLTPLPKSKMMPRRRVQVGDDIASLEQRQYRAHRREILSDVDHHRQIERRRRLLRAPQSLEIVGTADACR